MPRSEIQENQAKDSDFLSEQEFADAHADTTPVTPDDGTGAAGTSSDVSRADHKHPEHANTPTDDQAAALDAANAPAVGNPVATIADLITNTDETAKVSANDTTAGFLNGKLVGGTNITLTENNDGANETLTISSSAAAGGATNTVVGSSGITNVGDNVDADLAPTYGTAANTISEGDHTHALDDLSDVDATGPADEDALIFDTASGDWVAGKVGPGTIEPGVIQKEISSFIPSSPSAVFQMFGDGANAFKPQTDIGLRSVQVQLKQGNANNLDFRIQVFKHDGGTVADILIFDLSHTTAGTNNDYRFFETTTIENPGEEEIDVSDGDRLFWIVSNNIVTSGPAQVSDLSISVLYEPITI